MLINLWVRVQLRRLTLTKSRFLFCNSQLRSLGRFPGLILLEINCWSLSWRSNFKNLNSFQVLFKNLKSKSPEFILMTRRVILKSRSTKWQNSSNPSSWCSQFVLFLKILFRSLFTILKKIRVKMKNKKKVKPLKNF